MKSKTVNQKSETGKSPVKTSSQSSQKVFAFIDGENLHLAVETNIVTPNGKTLYRGRILDYRKFRHYLYQKFGVTKAFIFLGYLSKNDKLYDYLRRSGFELIFKRVNKMMIHGKEKVKGNVDIDIAVWSCGRTFAQFNEAVFVSGDGDFAELYDFMQEREKLRKIIVPNQWSYSKLLRAFRPEFLNNVSSVFKEKTFTNKKMTGGSGRNKSLGVSGRGRLDADSRNHGPSLSRVIRPVKNFVEKSKSPSQSGKSQAPLGDLRVSHSKSDSPSQAPVRDKKIGQVLRSDKSLGVSGHRDKSSLTNPRAVVKSPAQQKRKKKKS